jgi:DNA-binding transcriptional MerR regulator
MLQLADLAGVPIRTVRHYLKDGILPRPRFAGPATRYARGDLLWLLAIRSLQIKEKVPLAKMRARLSALSAAELEALATDGLGAGPTATALGLQIAPPAAAPDMASNMVGRDGFTAPRWLRYELALGLELHVRDDAGAAVMDKVRRILEM